jgi:hypothetical protein
MQTVTTILAFIAGVVLIVISVAPPPPLTAKSGDAWAGHPPPIDEGRGR